MPSQIVVIVQSEQAAFNSIISSKSVPWMANLKTLPEVICSFFTQQFSKKQTQQF